MNNSKRSILGDIFNAELDNEYIAIRVIKSGKLIASYYVSSIEEAEQKAYSHIHDGDVYFGVCTRKTKSAKEKDCQRAYAIWADIDNAPKESEISFSLAPSLVVHSGGGLHAYWILDEPTENLELVKEVTNSLAAMVGGDNVGDSSRLLRVNGTFNYKQTVPRQVELVSNCSVRYTLTDIANSLLIPENVTKKILSGDSRGYKSRSERDWAVICELAKAGLSEECIYSIFDTHKIGDKGRERNGSHYLEFSVKKAIKQHGLNDSEVTRLTQPVFGIFEKDRAYWKKTAKGAIQISTFVFEPHFLLRGDDLKEDSLLGDLHTDEHTWQGITISKTAFTNVNKFDKQLPRVECSWLGNDSDLRHLLPLLLERLKEQGTPTRLSVNQLGNYENNYWLGTSEVLKNTGEIISYNDSPVVLLPSVQERPSITFSESPNGDVQTFFKHIAKINNPAVVWPVLGWTTACILKSKLSDQGFRFPTLNLYGTRGSGKTSIITEIIQKVFGYDKPRTWDCSTTSFVILFLFGSSSSIPIAFSEYRRSLLKSPDLILRYILLAYDSGRAARGRPDQSIKEYPLTAPITVDGEEAITDAAALERIIQVNLHPEDIKENTIAHKTFQEIQKLNLKGIGTQLILKGMNHDLNMEHSLSLCKQAFRENLPDRIRRNLSVVIEGLFCLKSLALEYDSPFPELTPEFIRGIFAESLDNLLSSRGRTLIVVDEFIEDLINEAAHNLSPEFSFKYETASNTIWFHLSSTLSWWYAFRRKQAMPTLDRTAIKSQLKERFIINQEQHSDINGQYIVDAKTVLVGGTRRHCYGVSLSAALDAGLDIPDKLSERMLGYK